MANGHATTQAFIAICLICMICILCSLSKKFYERNKAYEVPNSHPIQSTSSGTSSPRRSVPRKKKHKPISKLLQISSITSITAYTIAVAIDFCVGVYYFSSGIDIFHTPQYWIILLSNIFLCIATVSLYTFMFGRLYLTFQASIYKISKLSLGFIMILMILDIACFIFYNICIGLLFTFATYSKFYSYLNVSFLALLIVEFTLNTFILSLFLYKLSVIIIDYTEMDYAEDYNHVNYRQTETIVSDNDDLDDNDPKLYRKQSIQLNNKQTKMITIMTRHSILCFIAILFNILFYVSVIHGGKYDDINDADLFFLAYSNLIKAFYGLAVSITLYLNFAFNIDLYFKLCNKWHLFCYNGFVKISKREIKKHTNDEIQHVQSVKLSTPQSK
eukprot:113677_1